MKLRVLIISGILFIVGSAGPAGETTIFPTPEEAPYSTPSSSCGAVEPNDDPTPEPIPPAFQRNRGARGTLDPVTGDCAGAAFDC